MVLTRNECSLVQTSGRQYVKILVRGAAHSRCELTYLLRVLLAFSLDPCDGLVDNGTRFPQHCRVGASAVCLEAHFRALNTNREYHDGRRGRVGEKTTCSEPRGLDATDAT